MNRRMMWLAILASTFLGTIFGWWLARPDDYHAITVHYTKTDVNCVGDYTGSITIKAEGGGKPFDYTWEDSQDKDFQRDGLTVGHYKVKVTDQNGATEEQDIEIIANHPAPPIPEIDLVSQPTNMNSGGKLKVRSPIPGIQYDWDTTPPQTGSEATGLKAGAYSVTATDPTTGCSSKRSPYWLAAIVPPGPPTGCLFDLTVAQNILQFYSFLYWDRNAKKSTNPQKTVDALNSLLASYTSSKGPFQIGGCTPARLLQFTSTGGDALYATLLRHAGSFPPNVFQHSGTLVDPGQTTSYAGRGDILYCLILLELELYYVDEVALPHPLLKFSTYRYVGQSITFGSNKLSDVLSEINQAIGGTGCQPPNTTLISYGVVLDNILRESQNYCCRP